MKLKTLLFFVIFDVSRTLIAQIPSYVPANGLTGYWPFTGNANDQSGNGNNGTVYGATLTSDRFNNANSAYNFNGSSDFISTNYAGILGANPRAVSFWAKTSETVAFIYAVGWGDNQFSPNAGTRFACGFNTSTNGASIGGADCFVEYTAPSQISNSGWHHYVYQFNATLLSQVEIYQDGVLLTQVANTLRPNSPVNTVHNFNVHFGKIVYPPSPNFYNGGIDDIGIWNRVLTNAEIQSLYQSTIVTAIKDVYNENSFTVYPNPSAGSIKLRGIKSPSTIEVYNALGTLIYTSKIEVADTEIDLSNEDAGVYFIKTHTAAGKITTGKFVKE